MIRVITRPNPIKMTLAQTHRFCNTSSTLKDYSQCYKILQVPNGSDEETVKEAFIQLCKKYHPDSGKDSANSLKFQEIESAYRLLQKKFSKEGIGEYGLYYKSKANSEETQAKVFDIKHTAPQHRQYLSYDGVGSGTPSQRQKQYVKYRTASAAENVYDHHIKKLTASEGNSLVSKDKMEAKKIKTRYGIERLVEDLIQESMAKGHFDNLKGQGKPLPPSSYNPYVDFTTHKINQIMIENGFVPEWISLEKEISDEVQFLKETLHNEREKLGSYPLNPSDNAKWHAFLKTLNVTVDKLNKKINKYNLIVPIINKQKLHFNLDKESSHILMRTAAM